jgi:FKBP-type peptidyl-prolyl cis-trans isomerase FkpA
MMKKIFYGLILSSVVIAGCFKKGNTTCPFKDSNVVAPAAEIDSLQKILADSGITASQHPSGLFYRISTVGTGTGIINLCSKVTVSYKGYYFNGEIFDSSVSGSPAIFQPGQVIVGWQKGIPLISKGGFITLYIPPSLAYGANPIIDTQGNIIIPGNSYLVFDIHILDIQ